MNRDEVSSFFILLFVAPWLGYWVFLHGEVVTLIADCA
jgi:hypothetical protein